MSRYCLGKDEPNGKWKHARSNQIDAKLIGALRAPHGEFRFFGIRIWKAGTRYIGNGWLPLKEVPDSADCERTFEHECGVVQLINVLTKEEGRLVLYLDGYPMLEAAMGRVSIVFADAVDEPTAKITFKGRGTRFGELHDFERQAVQLTFKNREQLKRYLVAIKIDEHGAKNAPSKTPTPQESAADSSLWPFAAGVLLGAALD